MQAIFASEAFKRELRNDVFRPEECVNLYCSGVNRILDRRLVYYHDILEDKSGERLEVDLLECDLAVKLLRKRADRLVCNACLHSGCLDCQSHSNHDRSDSDECQPEYLQSFLYSLNVLIVQLAKIVKISEKIRIFAAGYAKHIMCLHCHATLTIAYVIARKDKVLTWQSV